MALLMKEACDRCGVPLDTGADASICAIECTFCASCSATMDGICPNCDWEIANRPKMGSVAHTHRMHNFAARTTWVGAGATGTSGYRAYTRDYLIEGDSKPVLAGSSDAAFRGDRTRWNPEELFVAALSACHMLTYLHLCADAGIVVRAYEDAAEGAMTLTSEGQGRMTRVHLHPRVGVDAGTDVKLARRLHREAHARCFLASSVAIPVTCEPKIVEK